MFHTSGAAPVGEAINWTKDQCFKLHGVPVSAQKGKKSVSGKRPNHKITIYEVESGVLRQFIVATKASN